MGYIGNEPTTGHFPVDNFTSSGGSTYTLSQAPASAGAIEVSVQGILQSTTAYSISGTTLTMAGVTSGVKIFVRHLGETLVLPTPADGSVTTAKLGINSVDGTKIAMGSDAAGDILYHGATDYARLAKGTAAQVLTMNAGATAPEWAAAGGGLYESVAIIADRKAYDAQGGTATSGAWRTRDLNTELSDPDGIVSISSNQFTLQAGTYTIEWSAPCYMGGRGAAKLYNITDAADVGYGNTHYTAASAQSDTYGAIVTTISGATVYEIQQRVETTKADYGFGNRFNLDATGYSIYTSVKILKHS
jgi:hypothetical protein